MTREEGWKERRGSKTEKRRKKRGEREGRGDGKRWMRAGGTEGAYRCVGVDDVGLDKGVVGDRVGPPVADPAHRKRQADGEERDRII